MAGSGIDVNSLLSGGAGAAAITAAAAFFGKMIGRSTTIDTANIDDRSKFVKDLMKRLEDLEAQARRGAVREQRLINLVLMMSADLRLMLDGTESLLREIDKKPTAMQDMKEAGTRLVEKIKRAMMRLEMEITTLLTEGTLPKTEEQKTQ